MVEGELVKSVAPTTKKNFVLKENNGLMASENSLWFVVKQKCDGSLALKHPTVMGMELEHCTLYGNQLPYFILKEFDSLELAAEYLTEIYRISELINDILKKDA